MSGVQFIINEKGGKTAAIIDLKKHSQLWEDFFDALTTQQRAKEPRESLLSLKKRLIKSGKIRG